jgi:hypothetical protein
VTDRPARPRWRDRRIAEDGTTPRRTTNPWLGIVPDPRSDPVPDDPSTATTKTDEAIRRALGSLADEWTPGTAWTTAEEDVAVHRLLAEARRRSHRRLAIAGAVGAAVAIGIGLVGVVGALGSGGPRSVEAASGARPVASGHGDEGTVGCVLVQVGAAPATCAGSVVEIASNGTASTNDVPAAPSGRSIGQTTAGAATAGSGTAAAPGSSGPIDFGVTTGPLPSAGSSAARSAAASPVVSASPSASPLVLQVGATVRIVLPARPGVVWTYPVVHSAPAGSAAAASGVARSDGAGTDGAGTASVGSGAAALLRRVGGSGRSVDHQVTAWFVARHPGSAVLVASAAAPCRPTHQTCATPRWQWQVPVEVLPSSTRTSTSGSTSGSTSNTGKQ